VWSEVIGGASHRLQTAHPAPRVEPRVLITAAPAPRASERPERRVGASSAGRSPRAGGGGRRREHDPLPGWGATVGSSIVLWSRRHPTGREVRRDASAGACDGLAMGKRPGTGGHGARPRSASRCGGPPRSRTCRSTGDAGAIGRSCRAVDAPLVAPSRQAGSRGTFRDEAGRPCTFHVERARVVEEARKEHPGSVPRGTGGAAVPSAGTRVERPPTSDGRFTPPLHGRTHVPRGTATRWTRGSRRSCVRFRGKRILAGDGRRRSRRGPARPQQGRCGGPAQEG
jgi:hypothetical protein